MRVERGEERKGKANLPGIPSVERDCVWVGGRERKKSKDCRGNKVSLTSAMKKDRSSSWDGGLHLHQTFTKVPLLLSREVGLRGWMASDEAAAGLPATWPWHCLTWDRG